MAVQKPKLTAELRNITTLSYEVPAASRQCFSAFGDALS